MGSVKSAIMYVREHAQMTISKNLCPDSLVANYNARCELVSVVIFTSKYRTIEGWFAVNPFGIEFMRCFMAKYYNKLMAADLRMLANVADLMVPE